MDRLSTRLINFDWFGVDGSMGWDGYPVCVQELFLILGSLAAAVVLTNYGCIELTRFYRFEVSIDSYIRR